MPSLFDPIRLGEIALPNRIIMAPLTRSRAGKDRIPNALMAEYYTQRASAGLILTEATSVTPMGVGYAETPGMWNDAQEAGWKTITEAVHQAGGRIMLQLWHVGRISHPSFLDGATPVAPSAIQPKGHVSLIRPITEFVKPRALSLGEIADIIAEYRQAAVRAKRAGFDGVELHAANGYLIDQFLQSSTNQRTDRYGGSVENRARLLLEIVDQLIEVWGAGRVGVHLAPRGDAHDMGDANPLETFGHVAKELGKRHIAFIFTREHLGEGRIGPELRKAFRGPLIGNEKLDGRSAQQLLDSGEADAVSFGKLFIANPDLPQRLKQHAPLNQPRPETFYQGGAEGYTDYPTLDDALAKAS